MAASSHPNHIAMTRWLQNNTFLGQEHAHHPQPPNVTTVHTSRE